MADTIIQVRRLSKKYRVPIRPEGLAASLKNLFQPSFSEVNAVENIHFEVGAGEMVGLIGPNGAGKTTTLKMLSGLLYPSSGEVHVAGFVPWERRPEYLRRISIVLGNKSQMLWDIPAMDSFIVLSEIYAVPEQEFRRTLDDLIDLLEMKDLLNKPVRNLSLGERMKCELVASLLYRPALLFLDEPTLGLDVSMQLRLRQFLKEYNRRNEVTVLLTSHYMADVQALCPRVILIHQGKLLYDGALDGLARHLAPFKLIKIILNTENGKKIPDFNQLGGSVELLENEENRCVLRAERKIVPDLTSRLLQSYSITDLSIEDPPIEAVLDQIYSGGAI
ncbi:MAG: ATP-binding cassette domain-containing protein [Chloroflexi bacterium]|nr:ATP-binding cassette domain-containing protein [Chloroflexota bacterium]